MGKLSLMCCSNCGRQHNKVHLAYGWYAAGINEQGTRATFILCPKCTKFRLTGGQNGRKKDTNQAVR